MQSFSLLPPFWKEKYCLATRLLVYATMQLAGFFGSMARQVKIRVYVVGRSHIFPIFIFCEQEICTFLHFAVKLIMISQ